MNDFPDLDYTAIRKRAERRLALRLSAIMHIISIIALSPSLYPIVAPTRICTACGRRAADGTNFTRFIW
jgi:hypothetical protein